MIKKKEKRYRKKYEKRLNQISLKIKEVLDMNIKSYFKKKGGFGVLSTADEKGKVNAAPYASPHVIDDTHIAFIMSDRLSHAKKKKNPYAAYLFKERGFGYKGVRLYLKMERESDEQTLVKNTCKLTYPGPYCVERFLKGSFIVFFKVESTLPLIVDDTGK